MCGTRACVYVLGALAARMFCTRERENLSKRSKYTIGLTGPMGDTHGERNVLEPSLLSHFIVILDFPSTGIHTCDHLMYPPESRVILSFDVY